MLRNLSLFGAVVLAVSAALPAQAVEVARNDFQGAVGVCRNAVPTQAAGVRFRPLGIANESTGSIFLSCSFQGDDAQNGIRGATRIYMTFSNYAATAQTVSCTLVDGFVGRSPDPTYTVKTVSIAPGVGATLQWVPTDISATTTQIKIPSMSCQVPVGVTVHSTGKEYREDIGA